MRTVPQAHPVGRYLEQLGPLLLLSGLFSLEGGSQLGPFELDERVFVVAVSVVLDQVTERLCPLGKEERRR